MRQSVGVCLPPLLPLFSLSLLPLSSPFPFFHSSLLKRRCVDTSLCQDDRPLTVWTSTLKRTIATSRYLPPHYNQLQWKALDELDSGVCDGLTYQEIKDRYPEDFAARDEDKYNYRYRGGESYRDVVIRLEPIIMELERSEDILIVTHQAVLRCIYAYFMKKDQAQSPWMNVPLHTLIKLTPRAYGTEEERYEANIPAVSTWRGKGSTAKHENPAPQDGL